MNLRCKKGDACFVVAGGRPDLLGHVCTTEVFTGPVESNGLTMPDCWLVKWENPKIADDGKTWADRGYVPDAHLKPIEGRSDAVREALHDLTAKGR